MAITWAFALILGIGFRFWGFQHPDTFVIRPLVVLGLLFGLPLGLGFWVVFAGFRKVDS